ncbi:hypothetical protein DDZ14_16665 [Maritimibacter sp. 55A14]|uniref:copper chaperone PCu(A)C n=1 Tax=Maritimibacter sp. 55A14 TaxID=2174844 RepID=UPI000D614A24|nr:copper chaperone PCu(A)C [Maritimibacter sp. 55A14]PWE29860.1 hypothetical protein DDZ14_16665 [Maritimibacter sp. 55A14]
MKTIAIAFLAAALPGLAAADVIVTAPWARASILVSRPGAAYLTLTSDTGDRLIAVKTPAADRAMLHGTETDADGVSRMAHIEALDLSPGETVTLAPGGMHLMLMGLAAKLEEGASFPLILRFESAGEVAVDVPVLGVAATGPEGEE